MAKGLNPKRQRFVEEYLVDKNGTAAAIRAGYPAKSARAVASRMLSFANVREAVDQGLAKQIKKVEARVEKAVMTKAEWLKDISAIASADITDAFQPGPDGRLRMNLEQIKASGFGKLIRKIKVSPDGKIEFEMHAKLPAMELLGKASGWVHEHIEHSGTISQTVLAEQDFKNIFSDPNVSALALQLAEMTSKPSEHQGAVKAPEKDKS